MTIMTDRVVIVVSRYGAESTLGLTLDDALTLARSRMVSMTAHRRPANRVSRAR